MKNNISKSNNKGKQIHSFSWSFLSFITLVILFLFLGNEVYKHAITEQQKEVVSALYQKQIKLQEVFLESQNATNDLSLQISDEGEIQDFEKVASNIINRYKNIDILQLDPGGIIKYTYPLKGNESVIGLNIFDIESQKEGIRYAIEKKDFHFTGPFKLHQGGIGFAIRRPLYRGNQFWGFAAVIIKMKTLLAAANIDSLNNDGFEYQLANIDLKSGDKKIFLPFKSQEKNAQSTKINLPGGEWQLSVFQKNDINYFNIQLPFLLLGLVFSFLAAFFVFNSLEKRKKADKQIRYQKHELDKMFERILEGYIQLDNLWEIVAVNSTAEELLKRTQQDLVGKNFFTEFPDFMEYKMIRDVIETKRDYDPIHLKAVYTKIWDSWYDAFVYPYEEGVSIYFNDVSKQKKAELELEKNEKKYRTLIEEASLGIVVYSMDKSIHEYNKAVCEMIGYTYEEFSDVTVDELLVGNFIINEKNQKEILNGHAVRLVRDIRHKKGHIVSVEMNVKMIEDGKIIAIINDITEKQNSEILVKESELKYRTLFEQAADCIIIYDQTGKILDINPAVCKLIGLSKPAIINSYITDFIDSEELNRNPLNLKEILTGNNISDLRKIKTNDGSAVFLELNSQMLPNGNILVLGKDITEIIESKNKLTDTVERLSLATNMAKLGIWEYDFIKKEHTWNDRMYEIYDYPIHVKSEELNAWFLSVHPDDCENLKNCLDEAISQGKEFEHFFRVLNKKGDVRYVECHGRVVKEKENPVKIIGVNRDISDRYAALEAVRKSNELYQLVTMATNDAIWDWDLKTDKIHRLKGGLKKVYGFDENDEIESMGKWKQRIHPDDKEALENLLKKIKQIESENYFQLDYRFLKPDGNYVYVQDLGYIIRDEQGVPVRMIGAAKDITERKIAEAELKKSEEKYRSLIQQASDGILIYSFEGRILDCNEIALKQTGYSREELLGLPISKLIKEEEAKIKPFKFDDLQKGIHVIMERNIIGKNGNLVSLEVNSKMMPDGHIMAIGRDISDRKKGEEGMQKLMSLVETSNDIIGITNLDGVPIFLNKASRDLLEIDENEDISKFHFTDFINPEDVETVVNGFMPAFTENKKWSGEFLLRSFKTNQLVPLMASIFVIRDSTTGKAIAIGNVSYNIADRKKAEIEMKQLNERLRTLTVHLENVREVERKEIAREIHDELGQQLTGLKMQVGLMAKKIDPEYVEVREQLVDIQELVAQMVGSVKRIIFNLRPNILDDFGIVATMDSFANEFQKRYNIKTTFISSHDDLRLDPAVSVELFRIFQESLTNIAKHADAKKVVATFDFNEKGYVLAINDDGIGFELTTDIKNSSYGLMGMNERAVKVNATFELKSQLGKGTTVIVKLPIN